MTIFHPHSVVRYADDFIDELPTEHTKSVLRHWRGQVLEDKGPHITVLVIRAWGDTGVGTTMRVPSAKLERTL